jgi:tetratricopeptide (TPR) repeat protein
VTPAEGRSRPFRGQARTAGLAIAAALGVGAQADASVPQAESDYRNGKFAQAAEEYRRASDQHPGDPRLQLNLGTATYKSGNYAAAAAALQRALHTEHLALQQQAYYDLGNVEYRQGEKTSQSVPQQTIDRWKESIASYEAALKLSPTDPDAAYNRDLVKRKLAELEKQQKDPRKEDKKDNPQNQAKNDQAKGNDSKQAENGQGKGSDPQQAENGQGKSSDPKQAENGQGKGSDPKQAENSQGKGSDPKPAKNDGSLATAPEAGNPLGGPGRAMGASPDHPQSVRMAEAQPKPGQLSKDDAQALLDALKGDERLMSGAGLQSPKQTDDEPTTKDW